MTAAMMSSAVTLSAADANVAKDSDDRLQSDRFGVAGASVKDDRGTVRASRSGRSDVRKDGG